MVRPIASSRDQPKSLGRLVVDLHDPPVAHPADLDACPRDLEDGRQPLLALLQRPLDAPPLGDVAEDPHQAGAPSEEEGRGLDVGEEDRAVLALDPQAVGLGQLAALDPLELLRDQRAILAGVQILDGEPGQLLGGVPEHPLELRVAQHEPVAVRVDDDDPVARAVEDDMQPRIFLAEVLAELLHLAEEVQREKEPEQRGDGDKDEALCGMDEHHLARAERKPGEQ